MPVSDEFRPAREEPVEILRPNSLKTDMTADLIAEGRAGSADEIRELMSGNLCRCGAYPNIVAAIQQAMTQS